MSVGMPIGLDLADPFHWQWWQDFALAREWEARYLAQDKLRPEPKRLPGAVVSGHGESAEICASRLSRAIGGDPSDDPEGRELLSPGK